MDFAQVFKIDKSGVKVRRGLEVLVALVVPLVVMGAMGLDRYWLSFAFAMLFTALSDLGGNYPRRLEAMAAVGILGGVATTLGFVLGGGPWGLVVAVSFVLVLLAGLSLKLGKHGFVSGRLLVAWFLVAISESAGHTPIQPRRVGGSSRWHGGAGRSSGLPLPPSSGSPGDERHRLQTFPRYLPTPPR